MRAKPTWLLLLVALGLPGVASSAGEDGATATEGMTHVAIQESVNGTPVHWMEKVTDEEYGR